MITIFSSCTSDEEEMFSCNKQVDEWVKDHLSEIRVMDRTDWLNSPNEKALAMYRAFTPDQRLSFWNAKIEEVLRLNWSEAEINHIRKAQIFLNSNSEIFSDFALTTEERDDLVDEFCYKWTENAITELGWTETIAKSILMSGKRVLNTDGELQELKSDFSISLLSDNEEVNCNCNKNDDFCSHGSDCVDDPDCNTSERGCGWLWLSGCNGRCGIIGFGPA